MDMMIEPNFVTGLQMGEEDEKILRLVFKHNPFLKAVVWNKHWYKIQRVYGMYPHDVFQVLHCDRGLECEKSLFSGLYENFIGHCVTDFFKNNRKWLGDEHGVVVPGFGSFKELKMKYELYGMS